MLFAVTLQGEDVNIVSEAVLDVSRMSGKTYENLCDGAEIVLELVVSVDDGATNKDLRLRHDGGV